MYKVDTRANIELLQDILDRAEGYPRSEDPSRGGRGVRVGGGRHAPWSDVWTDRAVPLYVDSAGNAAIPVTRALDAYHGREIEGRTIDVRTGLVDSLTADYRTTDSGLPQPRER